MKFPSRDSFTSTDDYIDAICDICALIHKELINDNLMLATNGDMTDEQQTKYYQGKLKFSDEPQYKLVRLISKYNNCLLGEKADVLLQIIVIADKGDAYLNRVQEGSHDARLRVMADLGFSLGWSIKEIAENLVEKGFYDNENIDSLERTLRNWRNKEIVDQTDLIDSLDGEVMDRDLKPGELVRQSWVGKKSDEPQTIQNLKRYLAKSQRRWDAIVDEYVKDPGKNKE